MQIIWVHKDDGSNALAKAIVILLKSEPRGKVEKDKEEEKKDEDHKDL
jgi:hypothetical protein